MIIPADKAVIILVSLKRERAGVDFGFLIESSGWSISWTSTPDCGVHSESLESRNRVLKRVANGSARVVVYLEKKHLG